MGDSNRPGWLLEAVKEHRYFRLLLPILVLIATAYALNVGSKFPVVAAVTFVLAFAVAAVVRTNLKYARLKSPNECKYFFPFLSNLKDEERGAFLFGRAKLLQLFSEKVASSPGVHLVVVGPSGAGKSTLLWQYVGKDKERRHLLTDPAMYLHHTLTALAGGGLQHISTDFVDTTLIDNAGPNIPEVEHAIAKILNGAVKTDNERPYVIIFDQAERLSLFWRTASVEHRNRFLGLLSALRLKGVRIIFSIRSETLAEVLAIMPDKSYELFFVREESPQQEFRDKLGSLHVGETQSDQLFRAISRNNGRVNPFVYQLSGYLVESNQVDDLFRSGYLWFDDERALVDVYLDKLLDEYGYTHGDHIKAADLEIVLFTICCFNKRLGQGIPLELVGRIAHVPQQSATACCTFLADKKVIGDPSDAVERIRVAHDVLIDQILSREPRHLQADRRLAIEQIVERNLGPEALVETLGPSNPIHPAYMFRRDGNSFAFAAGIETVLLWISAALFWFRIFRPNEVANFWFIPRLNEFLSTFTLVVSPEESNVYFAAILFTHYIWSMFFFGMNAGFFHYLRKTGELNGFWFVLLQIIVPISSWIAIALSFAPALFIIPITICGLVLAMAYGHLYWSRDGRESAIYRTLGRLGMTTSGNMFICAAVCYLLVASVTAANGPLSTTNILLIYLACGLFLYFAYEMRDYQGSEIGRNSLLAMYDAGRKRPRFARHGQV